MYSKRRELEWELRNERPNDYLITIDGKGWKVFSSMTYSERYVRDLCERKTASTGKQWKYTPFAG